MSAERQDTQAAQALVQARLDQLFRKHVRDDPADPASAALRRYMEAYRLAQAMQPVPAQSEAQA
jgi:hypothetical protein